MRSRIIVAAVVSLFAAGGAQAQGQNFDKVEIKATVRRAKDDNSPLDVSILVSACDEVKCLLPSTIKIKVEPK